MFTTTLLPDFKKLKSYFTDLTDEQIAIIEQKGGVNLHLEHINEARYAKISKELEMALKKYHIQDHHPELLYLIIKKYEALEDRIEALYRNYDDDLTSKEVAQFLLAYKTSRPNQDFYLSAKPISGTVTVKDSAIARWMAEQIYKAIEDKNYTWMYLGKRSSTIYLGQIHK